MRLQLKPPYAPMEAESVDVIPRGPEWQYEPKWDGFRTLAFRDSDKVDLRSKSGQPFNRYFPEAVEALREFSAKRFVLDGELVVPMGKRLAFDQLLQRIHPAESRVRRLAVAFPTLFIVFDLLADERGKSLVDEPLAERRERLEEFAARYFGKDGVIRLSPATASYAQARHWFQSAGKSLDGVIAKRVDLPYQSGNRDGMQKIKPIQTADCVVGGFRYASNGKVVGSLLLGLYDDRGLLHHVGYTSSIPVAERAALTKRLEALISPPGFTGQAPGGPSRWSTARSAEWQPLKPKLVIEVEYDHVTAGRFRHGTRLTRWRPEKSPRGCLLEQIEDVGKGMLRLLETPKRRRVKVSPK